MELRSHRKKFMVTLALFMAAALVGCSDSPTDPGPGTGGGTRSEYPDIPNPTSPGEAIPAFSSEVVRIEPLEGTFFPKVLDAYGTWDGQQVCGGTRQYFTTVTAWASDLALDSGNDYQAIAAPLQGNRISLLDRSGDAGITQFRLETPSFCTSPIGVTTADLVYRGGQLEAPVTCGEPGNG